MTQNPTGTVTFLFTDIEGSTRLWQEHPESMRDSLATHDRLMRSTIESHSGLCVWHGRRCFRGCLRTGRRRTGWRTLIPAIRRGETGRE